MLYMYDVDPLWLTHSLPHHSFSCPRYTRTCSSFPPIVRSEAHPSRRAVSASGGHALRNSHLHPARQVTHRQTECDRMWQTDSCPVVMKLPGIAPDRIRVLSYYMLAYCMSNEDTQSFHPYGLTLVASSLWLFSLLWLIYYYYLWI